METGFVNEKNINPAGTWSLGLLQMDFFYRQKPWYAGQFVRKVIPQIEIEGKSILYFTTLLNKLKQRLLSVLVRDVDTTFLETTIDLPVLDNGEIDFNIIESFISGITANYIGTLKTYLVASGLNNYILTEEEQKALNSIKNLRYEEFRVIDLFEVKNSGNILSRDIVENSGDVPYLCASTENNSVSSYIFYDEEYLDEGNCIFIGGKTFVVTYQENDFYSNDSHNLILYLKDAEKRNKHIQLFITTCIIKSLGNKYYWGDSISNKKIQKDTIWLPAKQHKPDYETMEVLASAIQKLVIKSVVLYVNKRIEQFVLD